MAALPEVLAVVKPQDTKLRELLAAEGARVVVCPDAHEGMSRSLVCGVAAAPEASGWVFALGDMPFIAPATIRAIAEKVEESGAIVMPEYGGKRGNPVGFAARYRSLLLEVGGDEGARSIVRARPQEVFAVACDDPGILRDIDRREDLGRG